MAVFDEWQEKTNEVVREPLGKQYTKGLDRRLQRHFLRLPSFLDDKGANRPGRGGSKKQRLSAAGAAKTGDDRESTLDAGTAFWGPYDWATQTGIFRSDQDYIVVRGQNVDRGSLVTASGEPLNAAFLGVLETGMERHRKVVRKMVTELQFDHGVDLKLISATVSGQADSDLGAWERDYSEAPDVIARRMTAKQIQAELLEYKAPDGWPQGVAYPTLPIDLQRHHDQSQIKPHWTKPFNEWNKTQLGEDKKRLTHLLAAARQIFYREHPDRRPGAPSVAQAAAQQVQPGVLHDHLNAVPLLRGLQGEVCATAAVGSQKLF